MTAVKKYALLPLCGLYEKLSRIVVHDDVRHSQGVEHELQLLDDKFFTSPELALSSSDEAIATMARLACAGADSAMGTLGAYEKAWSTRGKGAGKVGGLLGWLPLAGSLCIAFGYAVIVTYILKALVDSLVGTLMTTDTASWFGTFSSTPYSVIPYHIIVVVGTLLTLYLGAHSIEKTNKIMMPLFFIIFLILAVRVAFLPGSVEGYKFMFTPRWEALKDPMIWIWAMGQAFFSLSITGSGMIIYGSYLPKNEDVVHSSCMTAVLDTCAAMLAGLAILPSVFAFGLDPASGPKLLFITLPRVFQQMPFGRLFAFFFFISVLFAGITSLANMLEAVSEAAQTRLKLSRKTAVLLACGAALAVGLFIERDTLMGTLMDVITIYVVPIGAILGAVMAYWMPRERRNSAFVLSPICALVTYGSTSLIRSSFVSTAMT